MPTDPPSPSFKLHWKSSSLVKIKSSLKKKEKRLGFEGQL
jgi:hypothetical protein